MCHFLLLPYSHICSGEGKNLRKYELSFKLKQSFILMIEERTFVDFMAIEFQIFSFGGFYSNKICMMGKLHINNNNNCSPGFGDHDIVSVEAMLKPTLQKQKPRKVLLFGKADWPTLKAKMKLYQESFLSDHLGKTDRLHNHFGQTNSRMYTI